MSEGPKVPAVRILCDQRYRQRKSHVAKGLTAGPSGLNTFYSEIPRAIPVATIPPALQA